MLTAACHCVAACRQPLRHRASPRRGHRPTARAPRRGVGAGARSREVRLHVNAFNDAALALVQSLGYGVRSHGLANGLPA
jgi:hypothetical protein